MSKRFMVRVWDKEKKRMMYPGDEFNNGNCLNIDRFGNLHVESSDVGILYWTALSSKDYIKMQCTGLTDGDDNLAWEGDIVKCHERFFVRTGFIEWENGAFVVSSRNKEGKNIKMPMCDSNACVYGNFDIKGNIYEDPEFLEQLK